MTIHYHGTPITPNHQLQTLAGRNLCVSYFRPDQIELADRYAQSLMLDNGAFSAWRADVALTRAYWQGYAEWAERWLERRTTWAVIPDVIAGDEEDNDRLIYRWPRHLFDQSAPVWHLHESLERLMRLAVSWRRICIGSSAQYSLIGTIGWHARMQEAMNHICGDGPAPVWIHMLRGMGIVDQGYPFASVDSTDVGQNHNRNGNTAEGMAARWDAIQTPARWVPQQQLSLEGAA